MSSSSQLSQSTDVLIVGAGPAGLMAAITLARYSIDFKVIDKSPVPVAVGHASAFQPRTQEILQTLNLLHELDQRGHRHTNTAFWQEDPSGILVQLSRSREVVHSTPYPHVFNTDQGITEDVFGHELVKRGHEIFRPFELVNIEYSTDASDEFPVHVHVLNVSSQSIEVWACKYLLGSDGARGATRKAMGFTKHYQGGDSVWAVADVLVKTDFPDYRCRVVIRSQKGGCMLVPRKNNGVRIFVQLTEADLQHLDTTTISGQRRTVRQHMSAMMLRYIQKHVSDVLQPYRMDIADVIWQSHYRVRQGILNQFRDDKGRIFMMGDACHTHSPKAGQGLNISVQDSYNLTWKLALVLKGQAKEAILETYDMERRHIAQQLIDFDVKFSCAFAGLANEDASVMHRLWEQHHGFTSGLQHSYDANMLVKSKMRPRPDDLLKESTEPLTPGTRLLPTRGLVRAIDGNAVDLLDEMPSNGRFHIFVFAGDAGWFDNQEDTTVRDEKLLEILKRVNHEPANDFLPEDITHATCNTSNARYLVDMFMVYTQNGPRTADLEGCLSRLMSWIARAGFEGRLYEDGGSFHDDLGVDQGKGAVALIRPDGYVALVTSLDMGGLKELEDCFQDIFIMN